MSKYSIGIDFGSLSARGILVDISDGREMVVSEYEYPHAVIEDRLPGGVILPKGWALQDPEDYLFCIKKIVKEILKTSGTAPKDIIGIGIDFTSNTFLPVDSSGEPLCKLDKWKNDPHSWVKMWKHNNTQEYAERIQAVAEQRNEGLLKNYGGNISPSWMIPRLLEVLEQDPELYYATDRFIEAGDWLVSQLVGAERRSESMAGYKAFWDKNKGYPSEEFFAALNPNFRDVVKEKLSHILYPVGSRVGCLCEKGIALTGLTDTTAVAAASIDAHVSMIPFDHSCSGDLLLVIGTSTCHLMVSPSRKFVFGACGIVEDGIIPGMTGYEFGQNCVGDCFGWFIDNCVPESYSVNAKKEGVSLHQYLTLLAENVPAGSNGLLALDWWNGNRSVLCDYDLTGMILGLSIHTKPEDIYRALIEATAFSSRKIVESLEESGVTVNRIYACGGITTKNSMLMQIYADVLKKDIYRANSENIPALGSSILGALAAGKQAGGYDDLNDAVDHMGDRNQKVYKTNPDNHTIYDNLYVEFEKIHDYFGLGTNPVMKKLKQLRPNRNVK